MDAFYISFIPRKWESRCAVHPDAWVMSRAELRRSVAALRAKGYLSIRVYRS